MMVAPFQLSLALRQLPQGNSTGSTNDGDVTRHMQVLRAIYPDELEEVHGAWPPIFSVRLSDVQDVPGVGDAGVRLVFRFISRYPAAPPEVELRAAGPWMFSHRAAVQRHLMVRTVYLFHTDVSPSSRKHSVCEGESTVVKVLCV
jgi:hypothetical protein